MCLLYGRQFIPGVNVLGHTQPFIKSELRISKAGTIHASTNRGSYIHTVGYYVVLKVAVFQPRHHKLGPKNMLSKRTMDKTLYKMRFHGSEISDKNGCEVGESRLILGLGS